MADRSSPPRQQRWASLDVAKGLGILLVVFGHNPLVLDQPGVLYQVIYSFHLPLFLLLSGVFLPVQQPLSTLVADRADRLLKPYLATTAALAIPAVLLLGLPWQFYGVGVLYAHGKTLIAPPLWFLPHLLLVVVTGWLLVTALPVLRRPGLGSAVVLLALLIGGVGVIQACGGWPLGWTDPDDGPVTGWPELPWSVDLLAVSAFYFLLGFTFRHQLTSRTVGDGFGILALAAFAALHLFSGDTLDLNLRRYDSLGLSTLKALLGILGILWLSSRCLHWPRLARWTSYLGRNSLFLLLFHDGFQSVSFRLLNETCELGTAAAGVLALVAGCGVSLLLAEVLTRLPWAAVLFLPRGSTARRRGQSRSPAAARVG